MVEMSVKRNPDGSVSLKPAGKTAEILEKSLPGFSITTPKPRDLTWLEPRDQQERADMLNRLDAALAGANQMAGALGQTTTDYAGWIEFLRKKARLERHTLLAELESAAWHEKHGWDERG